MSYKPVLILALLGLGLLAACQSSGNASSPAPASGQVSLRVLAAETFLADIAQNVAGDRLQVSALVPVGVDPHGFEPAPADIARVAESQVLIVNGAGVEGWLEEMLQNVGGERLVITASAGLTSRAVEPGTEADHPEDQAGDPHFWLDPTLVTHYVENIRVGLTQADPAGETVYGRNADTYLAALQELDTWIARQVATIPPASRLMVTNHESFGYYADRYGFKVIGTLLPGVSSAAAPSAQALARLVDLIAATDAKAIFLETGASPQLAEQIAQETGITVVTGLFSHSISASDGPAPTYLAMMRYNTTQIVQALK